LILFACVSSDDPDHVPDLGFLGANGDQSVGSLLGHAQDLKQERVNE
jgi:hypothetical protein